MQTIEKFMVIDKIKNQLKFGENYIFASGRLGQYLYKFFKTNSIEVIGFIDNKITDKYIENLPVLSLSDVKNKNANIIVASINYMCDIEEQATKNGFSNVISFGKLTRVFPELQSFNQAFNGLWEDYQKNSDKYKEVYNLLDDNESKNVLDTIIEYRQTFNISLYSEIKRDLRLQYFEDFVPKSNVFVDGGSFDGENSLDFIKKNINYKHIYAFEPDKISMNNVKAKLSNFNNIDFLDCGISDKKKMLRFNSSNDLGSYFSNDGTKEIMCANLDDIVQYDRAYIKMDIEGAELSGINGAQRLIKNSSPLAICVYHTPQDIWEIPLRIKELNPHYSYKLRHYTNTIFETVLYAIPNLI